MQEEKTLKDKYDTIWDWLGGINQKPKVKHITENEKEQVNGYVKELTKKGKSKRFIKRAVLRKFKVMLLD